MEFRDLKIQYQNLKTQIDGAISKVCSDTDFISGTAVEELEKQLASYVGTRHCITCGNGTDALVLSLMAWGVGPGDAVFVPDFTFFASGEAPAFLGAVPVFVDVERDTFNISVQALEEAVLYTINNTDLVPKVIIAVDLFGQPADYPEIRKIADKYNLLVLEDAAQGFGGAIGNKKACSFGDISTTSFFPAKPLGCYGDGGAVFTNNDSWAEIIRSLCVHGKGSSKYDNVHIGMNSRLDTIQAAVLLVKLEQFKKSELKQVNQVAEWYSIGLNEVVVIPYIEKDYYSSWAQYTVICKNNIERQYLQQKLKEQFIPTMVYYAKGMHEQKAFTKKCILLADYNNTMYLKDRVLSLPVSPYMDKIQIEIIVNKILEYYKNQDKSQISEKININLSCRAGLDDGRRY